MRRFAAVVVLIALSGTALSPLARAAGGDALPPRGSADAAEPRYQLSFLPAAEIERGTWTQGYLPLPGADFKRLVEAAHAAAIGAPGASAAAAQSEYTARLVGDDLLVGTAVLQLAPATNAAGMLRLAPCSLALGAAHWDDQAAKAATIGLDADGMLRVPVAGTQLEFDWSLRAKRSASGGVGFELELPRCPVTRLVIDAPAALELSVEQAIVSKAPGAAEGTTRWTIEMGGRERAVLRLLSEATARERRPLTLLRQTLTYELSQRGANVGAQLTLDIHGEPLQRVAVNLDPGLRLVAARFGELQIPFAITPDTRSGASHAVLQLPEPIAGTGRVLQLSAMAPLSIGTSVRLPGVRPEGMAWQEGGATLLIPADLTLSRLLTDGCRQSRLATLPAPASGESIEIQYFQPAATIDVLLEEPREQLRIDSGTITEVGQQEIVTRQLLEVRATKGGRRIVQADVITPWAVESVEDAGTKHPLAWELEERDDLTHLTIRLESAPSADRPARILVRGKRPLPADTSFEARQLLMLELDSPPGDRLISVAGVEGMELRWAGAADLGRLDPLKLTPQQAQRFVEPPAGALFSADEGFAASTIGLERRRASYTADIRIDAAVQGHLLTETYAIGCAPETTRVDRLLVRMSEVRTSPLEWSLAGANSGDFSARKLTAAEQTQNGIAVGGEVWEINLQLEKPGAFELRAVRSTTIQEATPLCLASVASAAVQRGKLTLRALAGSGISINNQRLVSAPAELLEPDRYQTVRATYQFQPGRDDQGSAAVTVAPAGFEQATAGAWAWQLRLDSRYSTPETSVHWATIRLQTSGQQRLRATLPAGAQLQSAWINEQRVPLAVGAGEKPVVNLDLPPGTAFATVSLYYATPGGLPNLVRAAVPAFVELDVPVMERQWRVWLPPGFEIIDAPGSLPVDELAPLSISQRLFGALARNPGAQVFNPLDAGNWRQLMSGDVDLDASRQTARRFAETLGALMTEYVAGEAESQPTWGQLLTACAEDQSLGPWTVLIDTQSLDWLRLTPQTSLSYQPADTPLARGAELLRQANLVALARGAVVLLTSAEGAAAQTRQLAQSEQPTIFAVSSGPLASELESIARQGGDANYQSVAAWRAMGDHGLPPWTPAEPTRLDTRDAAGWRTYSLRASQDSTPRLRIVHTAAMRALAWPIFLSIVALGIWRRDKRPASLLVLGALAAALALVIPGAFVPLASAAFLGALVCLGLRVVHIPRRVAPSRPERSPSSRAQFSVVQQAGLVLLLIAAGQAGATLLASQPLPPRAATPTNNAPATDSQRVSEPGVDGSAADRSAAAGENTAPSVGPIHRVFVPLEQEQHAPAGKYYVPERFYRQLLQQSGGMNSKAKDWLLSRATYHGALARDPASKQLRLSQLKASYELQVLSANAKVQFPFPRENAVTLGACRLDGRPLAMTWNAAGDALELGTLDAEQHRLEIELRPPLQIFGANAGFDLPIPILATATVSLLVPPDAPRIELPSVRGSVNSAAQDGRVDAQLGPSNVLSVRWPAGIGMETSAATVDVEEMIWIKVRPGTTVVDARFNYRVREGSLRQIRLLADPRLRLLPTTSPDSPIAAVQPIAGDPQQFELELSRAVTDQVAVDLSFLLTGTSGVGNLQFPRLESSGVRATRRLMAVSVDPTLESREFPGEDSRPLAIADFMAAWGAADARPQAAYQVPRGEAMWVLATQPSAPRTSAEQTLTLSLGRGESRLYYEASLVINGGYLFQLSLAGPANLSIDQVSLLENGIQRVARWSRDDAGQIAVFLTGPITGSHVLSLQGRIANPPEGPFATPRISLAATQIKTNRWCVYRQNSVLATVSPGPGVVPFDPEVPQTRDSIGALVAAYQSPDPKADIGLSVTANLPTARAVMVTTLARDKENWTAEVRCRVEVAAGLVDSLAFEIPPQFTEPFRADPAAETKLIAIPGESRLLLVVDPREPIAKTYELTLRGRVAPSAGDRLRVPDIMLKRVQQVDRYIVLPQRLELQQIAWETVGLARAKLPAGILVHEREADSPAAFHVEQDRFYAALKGVQRASASARVKLADIYLVPQPAGQCQGVATFDIEPAGATSCVLELPDGCRVLHAAVDNVPACLRELGSNRFRVSLGPPELPQRFEVTYASTFASHSDGRKLPAPRLLDLEVDQTLWTVYSDDLPQPPAAKNKTVQRVSAMQQELQRLRTITEVAQLPAEIRGEHLPQEIVRWFRPWRLRYTATREALAGALAEAGPNAEQSTAAVEARSLDQQLAAVDARLGAPDDRLPGSLQLIQPAELLRASGGHGEVQRFASKGSLQYLEITDQRAATAPAGRFALALAICALAGVVIYQLGDRELPKLSPGVVLVVAGVAWWLLLSPSFLGLAVVACGAWLVIYDRGRFFRPAARS
ncbi:MAG: hypothetical protein AB7O59_23990 [Pirellulales bacterium]